MQAFCPLLEIIFDPVAHVQVLGVGHGAIPREREVTNGAFDLTGCSHAIAVVVGLIRVDDQVAVVEVVADAVTIRIHIPLGAARTLCIALGGVASVDGIVPAADRTPRLEMVVAVCTSRIDVEGDAIAAIGVWCLLGRAVEVLVPELACALYALPRDAKVLAAGGAVEAGVIRHRTVLVHAALRLGRRLFTGVGDAVAVGVGRDDVDAGVSPDLDRLAVGLLHGAHVRRVRGLLCRGIGLGVLPHVGVERLATGVGRGLVRRAVLRIRGLGGVHGAVALVGLFARGRVPQGRIRLDAGVGLGDGAVDAAVAIDGAAALVGVGAGVDDDHLFRGVDVDLGLVATPTQSQAEHRQHRRQFHAFHLDFTLSLHPWWFRRIHTARVAG